MNFLTSRLIGTGVLLGYIGVHIVYALFTFMLVFINIFSPKEASKSHIELLKKFQKNFIE